MAHLKASTLLVTMAQETTMPLSRHVFVYRVCTEHRMACAAIDFVLRHHAQLLHQIQQKKVCTVDWERAEKNRFRATVLVGSAQAVNMWQDHRRRHLG